MKARPFVTANFAMTWDGRVSTRRFTPTNFTSKRDKHRLLEIRATADAVLVGVSTIVADNMAMGMPGRDATRCPS
jgi:riboflavin biosynthesis pyrimidine reductase